MTLVTSVVDFIQQIESIPNSDDSITVFRGHSDEAWLIRPRVLREDFKNRSEEKDLIRQVISRYPAEFDAEKSTFDILTKLQHYNVPTRLLDVTSNPLIALFFALDPIGVAEEKNGCVLVLRVPKSRTKYYDSDTVSCLANLANLSAEEQEDISNYSIKSITDFNKNKVTSRLVQFIRSEKPYFEPSIRPYDLFNRIHVVPKLRNSRIIAQNGSFILFGLERENYKPDPVIRPQKISISGAHKESIKRELFKIGISYSYLFPEIDKISEDLRPY